MSGANKALAILVVAVMGLWGCTQGPTNGAGNVERMRALEGKCAKMEDDCRALAAARDQLKKKLTAVEDERNQLRQEVEQKQVVIKERDDLRQQLDSRTRERDTFQQQFEQLLKSLRSLVGQADSAAGLTNPPLSAGPTGSAGQS
jgi:SMC interacting uncharacterized protein involved in chromosome segregation